METICPHGYHNGSVANYALGQMMYGCNIVHHIPKCKSCQSYCGDSGGGHTVFMIAYILCLSCFCEI